MLSQSVGITREREPWRVVWEYLHWARDLDAQGLLVNELAIPLGIESGSRDDVVIRSEEGWILGCPRGGGGLTSSSG
jgi:hypothetical protein